MDQKKYGMSATERVSEYPFRAVRFRTGRPSRAGRRSELWDRNIRLSFVIEGLRSVARRSVGAVLRWRDRRIAIGTLEALSDYYLMDVGIERSDIPSFVANPRNEGEDAQ